MTETAMIEISTIDSTRVVNLKHEPCDVKIIRPSAGPIPAPPAFGCFGNPFRLSECASREACLELFILYFRDRLAQDHAFLKAIQELKGRRLGCVCRPPEGFLGRLLCHGQVIAGWLDDIDPVAVT